MEYNKYYIINILFLFDNWLAILNLPLANLVAEITIPQFSTQFFTIPL